MRDQLLTSLRSLRGVGSVMYARLVAAGVRYVKDLLLIKPLRVQHTPLRSLNELQVGVSRCALLVYVKSVVRRPRSVVVICLDRVGDRINVVIPHAKAWVRCIVPGSSWVIEGDVCAEHAATEFVDGCRWSAIHPSWTRYTTRTVYQEYRMIYPTIPGIPPSRLEDMIAQAVRCVAGAEHMLIQDLCRMHTNAKSDADLAEYVRRIACSELRVQYDQLRSVGAYAPAIQSGCCTGIDLPFQLTDEQNAALDDVCADLASTMPMSRVLQGDVGSGKTVVALAAGAYVMSAGYSVVFMAPTEVLAQQHFVTASKYLKHPVFLLTSRTKKTELDRIKQAKGPCLTIGTHALVYTELPKFAFAIIDEQHKFGVQQRLRLRKDGVHALSMSATLIPRSLHLVLTGHLQTSILRQKPAQRSEVRTFVLEETGIEEVYRHIANVLRGGFLVYWVCPAISENSKMELASVEARAAELAHHFPGLVGVLHGKLASKTQVLQHFTSGVTPILLSTTVIEVGMDVHRATLIVVEQSERFGLAQLHQLRGRVGRGRWPGTCFLMHGTLVERGALDRLKFLSDCYDGFKIAEYDLRNRGYGDPLGSAQSGQVEFKFFSPEMGDLYDGTRSDEVERLLWGRDVGTVYGV